MMEALHIKRIPFLVAGILSLVCGLAVGLVRAGWAVPLPEGTRLGIHGPLMICGFLGILIGLERAVALGRSWAFAVPMFTAAGVIAVLAAPGTGIGPVLITLASVGLLAIYAAVFTRQPSLFVAVMALGAAFWLVGNGLWMAGWPVHRLVFWWAGFPILTIAGERLELTRFLPPTRFGRLTLAVIVAALVAGAASSSASPATAPRIIAAAFLALSVWLFRYDVARRTIRQEGLARFTASCLLSGYVWLGAAGALALAHGGEFSGPIYDATLHAVFVGFVFSMIFGHAPIIFPAVLGGRAIFSRAFYGHLFLLHASLGLRVAGDLSSAWLDGSWWAARAWGAVLSAAAIALFFVNTIRSLRFRRDQSAPAPSSTDFVPARWVPLLYLTFAHASLATAFALLAADPRGAMGFYYHPHLVAIVHLVTLGWISGSILGALYIVCPLAFRTPLPARAADYVAFTAFAVGVTGMVAHFWIGALPGMVWASTLVVAALAFVGSRVIAGLRHAPVPGEARLPVVLAFVNVMAAGAIGLLLGINKMTPFLPSSQLRAVGGHAHLAALGWATLMVMGAGYRLLPMILPAAMPRGRWPYVATLLTQTGAWGIFLGFLADERWVAPAACVAAAGVGVFLSEVLWMARHRRPVPPERPQPDLSIGHAVQALAYLAVTCVIGLGLAFAPSSETALRWTLAYGTLGLVGFLAQIVVGVAGRLLPLYAWIWGFRDRDYKESPPSLHGALPRLRQALVLLVWTAGVPSLAFALASGRSWLLRIAAAALAAAVLVGGLNLGIAIRRLWQRRPLPLDGPVVPEGGELTHA